MSPCRYCLKDAREVICLDCRAKFEALERENAFLKSQNAFLRAQGAIKYRERKAEISRIAKPRRK